MALLPNVFGASPVSHYGSVSTTATREIDWQELAPADQSMTVDQMIGEVNHFGAPADSGHEDSRAVAAMDGITGTLTGYLVPITTDSQRRIVELFLVPYYGACIHVPPPPPNQIIYARPERPLFAEDLWDAYRVTGRLRIAKTTRHTGNALYAMDIERLEPIRDSVTRRYRWLTDGIIIALFFVFLFTVKAATRRHPPTRARQ